MSDISMQRKFLRRFKLREHLGVLFTTLMLATGLIIAFAGYRMAARAAVSATDHLVESVSNTVKSETMNAVYQPLQAFLAVLAQGPLSRAAGLDERLAALPSMQAILDSYPVLDAIYAGYEGGEFFLVRGLRSSEAREAFAAPQDSAVLVQSIESAQGKRRSEYLFFDADLRLLLRRPQGDADYDPRTRPWYQEAGAKEGLIASAPYIFFTTRQIGATFALRNRRGNAVVGADIGLSQLSEVLARELPTKGSRIVLFRPDGALLAASDGMVVQGPQGARLRVIDDLPPAVRLGIQAYRDGWLGRDIDIADGARDWVLSLDNFSFSGEVRSAMLLAVPRDEVLVDAMNFMRQTVVITAGILLLSVPLIWLTARSIARPLSALADKARRIQEFHLEEQGDGVRSRISEIHALGQGMDHMQDSLRKFLAISRTISAERNFNLLLERVLQETLAVADADGGMVALLDAKRDCFNEGSFCWKGQDDGIGAMCMLVHCDEPDATLPTYQALRARAVTRTSVGRGDPLSGTDFLAPGFDDPAVTRVDVVCVPLHDRMGADLGVLALFRAMKPGGQTFQDPQVAFIEALAGTAAIALENQTLIRAQRDLRDALIHIIAGAIDAKSPYTGGHCQRVPVIFLMLMRAACDAKEGPLKDFTRTEDQWEEAKLAGWLHDCGKVTTPEYVVDKATKLETIYDRIHEIRTRFEVLKRDAEIRSLRAVLGGAESGDEGRRLEEALRTLDEEFAFVASCNTGGEFMDDASIARLATIGKRTWTRTLDKRLGVSREELERMDRVAAEPLPVEESLLMDRPEHILDRGAADRIAEDNPWKFKVETPAVLYNRGEVHNLSIRRGTLTEEERYKINDHIIQTIIMLKQLPLPEHLRNVPDMAGSHHETMDGKGYPRRLARDDMDWSARMMAIADIFEALTASDRPYKPSKTLSEALKIMDGFRDRNHIDPDLYELFLKSGVPQQYAAKYLRPEQNDLAPASA